MGVATRPDNMSSTMMKLPSVTLRQTSGDWVFSQDIPSDVTVVVGGIAYALHKFPLVSRSGWIRRLVAESNDPNLAKISLSDLPGGSESFEYAAKFCYGINFEIDVKNVATLRCAAEYLEMFEDYAEENLVTRTEAYLTEVVFHSLQSCVTVLQTCENLMPYADELDIVSRCADGAASNACREQMTPSLSRSDLGSSGRMDIFSSPGNFSQTPKRRSVEWWVEEIAVLRIENFKRVIMAMKSKGMRGDSVGAALAYYAQKWLRGLLKKQAGQLVEMRHRAKQLKASHDTSMVREQEQHRVIIEVIVGMMPAERNVSSVSFWCAMLRGASYVDGSMTCRLEIERRIGWQLEQAGVDDLLIPSFSQHADTYFDLDCVSRLVGHFLQQEGRSKDGEANDQVESDESLGLYEYASGGDASPPTQSAVMKVARALDCLLAEVAPDANLSVSKFVAFAELMPDYARVVDDGLYRAIDIYLKAHPGVNDTERKKVACLMDCQKLSQEACSHAAQNERLPVQAVVQVLYFEQMRLRNAMSGSSNFEDKFSHASSGVSITAMSPSKAYSGALMEQLTTTTQRQMDGGSHQPAVEQMRHMRPRQLHLSSKNSGPDELDLPPPAYPSQAIVRQGDYNQQAGAPTLLAPVPTGAPVQIAGYIKPDGEKPKSRFFQSVTNALSRLNPFHRNSLSNEGGLKPPNTPDTRPRRSRRHSIS